MGVPACFLQCKLPYFPDYKLLLCISCTCHFLWVSMNKLVYKSNRYIRCAYLHSVDNEIRLCMLVHSLQNAVLNGFRTLNFHKENFYEPQTLAEKKFNQHSSVALKTNIFCTSLEAIKGLVLWCSQKVVSKSSATPTGSVDWSSLLASETFRDIVDTLPALFLQRGMFEKKRKTLLLAMPACMVLCT